MRYAHFAKICGKCGKVPNMRQSHIRVFLTCLRYTRLSTIHLKYGCGELFVQISPLFSALSVHGRRSSDLLISSIVPILQGKSVGRFQSSNHRSLPHSASSVMVKHQMELFYTAMPMFFFTSESQYGFKNGRSTTKCAVVLKKTADHYTACNCNGTVYCALFDATKTF